MWSQKNKVVQIISVDDDNEAINFETECYFGKF